MLSDQVAALRSFNRTVTERVGALHDGYLARSRPLGASRLLWEIGDEGCDVRTLRRRLGLDSGYVSRLLASLQDEGLVVIGPSAGDGRVRAVRPTPAGTAERELLDARSDELARSLLAPLDDGQRSRLIEAAQVVDRLLTAGAVTLAIEDPRHQAARYCFDQYFRELDARFDGGFDPSLSISADAAELTEPAGVLVVARLRERPVGCGALKLHDGAPAEVKRMWVSAETRGLGLGRRILAELERLGAERGATRVRLETNRNLAEAISLYRSAGYREVAPFNVEPFAHHWFEKEL